MSAGRLTVLRNSKFYPECLTAYLANQYLKFSTVHQNVPAVCRRHTNYCSDKIAKCPRPPLFLRTRTSKKTLASCEYPHNFQNELLKSQAVMPV